MGPKKAIEIKNKAEDELNALSENVVKVRKKNEYVNIVISSYSPGLKQDLSHIYK